MTLAELIQTLKEQAGVHEAWSTPLPRRQGNQGFHLHRVHYLLNEGEVLRSLFVDITLYDEGTANENLYYLNRKPQVLEGPISPLVSREADILLVVGAIERPRFNHQKGYSEVSGLVATGRGTREEARFHCSLDRNGALRVEKIEAVGG